MQFYALIAVIAGALFAVAYVVLRNLVPRFFAQTPAPFTKRSVLYSVLLAGGTIGLYAVYPLIPSWFWANRFQHAVGGGVMAFVLFYLVVRDTGVRVTRFQFFSLGFLVVTALGVANELAEFIADSYTPLVFTTSLHDTWYDLLSNTVGAFVAGGVLTWLYEEHRDTSAR